MKNIKYQSFLFENFQFLEVKFSMYLNRHVFVMNNVDYSTQFGLDRTEQKRSLSL